VTKEQQTATQRSQQGPEEALDRLKGSHQNSCLELRAGNSLDLSGRQGANSLTQGFFQRLPRVPWPARVFAACVVGYAFRPIDLIPDFIPLLGYLDDLILVPLGIALALKMVPKSVFNECRGKAQETLSQDKPRNWGAAVVVIALWLFLIALVVVAVAQIIRG